MKFYNPFKPHIVKYKNKCYFVRRLSFYGWQYKERMEFTDKFSKPYWWTSFASAMQWASMESLDEAIASKDWEPVLQKKFELING